MKKKHWTTSIREKVEREKARQNLGSWGRDRTHKDRKQAEKRGDRKVKHKGRRDW